MREYCLSTPILLSHLSYLPRLFTLFCINYILYIVTVTKLWVSLLWQNFILIFFTIAQYDCYSLTMGVVWMALTMLHICKVETYQVLDT